MDGSGIVEAKAVSGQYGGFEVSITMNDRAAVEWANLTQKNIGKPLAIVMDNVVYSAPNVRGRIDGGKSSITGNFTLIEALALAKLINAN
jgi:SecD/SecF fusion protein